MRPHACPAWENVGYHAILWAVKGNHAFLLAVRRKFESQLNRLTAFRVDQWAEVLSGKYRVVVLFLWASLWADLWITMLRPVER
jgi:hypothetical protein